jgi:ATP phosphoribosyltransferase regulatory subunit HisZ
MNLLLRLLSDEGAVVILRSHIMAAAVFEQCRDKLVALFAHLALVDIATFRQATGTSRRVAVELLEAFDGAGLTRRTEAGRVLVSHNTHCRGHHAAA